MAPQIDHRVQPWLLPNAPETRSLQENNGFAGLPTTECDVRGGGEKYRPGLNHALHSPAADSAGQLTAIPARSV